MRGSRRSTFELRGRHREGALTARCMIDSERLAAKVACWERSLSSEGLGVTLLRGLVRLDERKKNSVASKTLFRPTAPSVVVL